MMVGDWSAGFLWARRFEKGQDQLLRRYCLCCRTLCGEWFVRVERPFEDGGGGKVKVMDSKRR